MPEALDWQRHGCDWPNRHASRFVSAGGLRWHVQQFGDGPLLLLIHGTGAATHSWRALAPLLAERFTVVAPDLPGHGFTSLPPPDRLSLPAMANALSALLTALEIEPALSVGHSAGAAILIHMGLHGQLPPQPIISLNGALLPLGGLPGQLFSPLARLFAVSPLAARLFARRAANRRVVEGLLHSTGSVLDPQGIEYYARLAANSGHVSGALGMMANWDLRPLARALPQLRSPLILVVGANDRTIPPREAGRVQALLPAARIVTLPGLGHLAHEEQPQQIAELISRYYR